MSRCLDGWAFDSLLVVLGSLGAGFWVFLVEGDPFGLAHEGELDVDSVEDIGRQESDVDFACCDCGQHGPVLANEGDDVDAEGRINNGLVRMRSRRRLCSGCSANVARYIKGQDCIF